MPNALNWVWPNRSPQVIRLVRHFRGETITPAGYCLNEPGFFGRVVQGIAQLVDGVVQVVVEVNKRVILP